MEMKKTKENKAITLVALVITIVILLILAGITIAQLSGSGLFEKTKLAKETYKNAQEDEDDKIAKYSNEMDNIINNGVTREGLTEAEIDAKIATAIQNANKEELLWENSNKNSTFAAQTVSWTTTEYNRVCVIYKNYKDDSNTNNIQTSILYPGRNTSMTFSWVDTGVHINRRVATFSAEKNSVSFGKSNASGTETTDHIIPLYIIGYKSTINI